MRWRIKPLTSSAWMIQDDSTTPTSSFSLAPPLLLLLLLPKPSFSSKFLFLLLCLPNGKKEGKWFYKVVSTSFQFFMFGFGILNGRKMRRNGLYVVSLLA